MVRTTAKSPFSIGGHRSSVGKVSCPRSHGYEQWSWDSNPGRSDCKIYTPAGTSSHPGVSKARRGSCEAWRAWQDRWEEALTQRGTERRRAQVGGNASLDPQLLGSSCCCDSVAGPPGSISGASDSSASLGATCPAETLGHYSQPVSYSLFSAPCPPAHHSLPLCSPRVAKGSQQIWPVPTLASLAPILPTHPHLSHWDGAPQTLAHSTLTAVTLHSVPRNGAAWRSAHWAKKLPIPGLEGTFPVSQLASQQMSEDLPGPPHPCWMAPPTAPRTRGSLFRKIHSLAEFQHWSEKRRALLRPTSHLTMKKLKPREGT